MDWYNGYSPNERNAMGRQVVPPIAKKPPCAMCGDPSPPKMQTHAEDYSTPYRWLPPATYPLCLRCHSRLHSRLHSRFDALPRWKSFLEFLRRGWYAQEVPSEELRRQMRLGDAYPWRELPHDPPVRIDPNAWWWESLTTDKASLRSPAARPRP
jgi:hypothetical protein